MQEALESLFGPSVGLIGFAFMILMFAPKAVTWFKGRRAKKRAASDGEQKHGGMRSMQMAPASASEHIAPHPDHGEAIEAVKNDRISVILEFVCWIIPLISVGIFVPRGALSLRAILMIGGIFMACIGILTLFHLGDSVTFYRTGMTGRSGGKRFSVDYNMICSITQRPSIFPWMAPTYILHLDNSTILALDGAFLRCSHTRPHELLQTLSPRVITNAAQETLRRL